MGFRPRTPRRTGRSRLERLVTTLAFSFSASGVLAQSVVPNAPVNTFQIVGNSGVSAQQLFLGTLNKVYIVDKVENNPIQVDGHAAWGTEYDITTNQYRAMGIRSNAFCAGGNVLGNGTWLNVGGNQGVTTGGVALNGSASVYKDEDGGPTTRLLDSCDDQSCEWIEVADMQRRRWYPTVEIIEDGSAMIIGGCDWGGYVNSANQNEPSYEFFPPKGDGSVINLNILANTLPANLYPLTWLLPSGNMFINSNWQNIIYNYHTQVETPIADMPHSVRVYPASAATTMLPLTPANNYTATLIFCGGSNVQPTQWTSKTFIATKYPADSTCVRITPDLSTTFVDDDPLPEGRSMGQFHNLPDGTLFLVNGIGLGTAGYGDPTVLTWLVGQSYGDAPVYAPAIYNPLAAAGHRWTRVGLGNSTVPRMYHSSGTLLPDGSIFISGSNPNADVTTTHWPTEYRVERFYPWYYNHPRPQPTGLPTAIGYGGAYFDITLPATTFANLGTTSTAATTRVVIIRPGFSTHALQMGQRYLELTTTTTAQLDGSLTIHTSQVPPNIALLVPGTAYIFVTVNGVPSLGQSVMIGSGSIGPQPVLNAAALPASSIVQAPTSSAMATTSTMAAGATAVADPSATSGDAPSTYSGSVVVMKTGLPSHLAVAGSAGDMTVKLASAWSMMAGSLIALGAVVWASL